MDFEQFTISDKRKAINDKMFNLSFTIGSDTRYLAMLRSLVGAVAKLAGERRFPNTARQAVSLALIEAVDNAIFHAHSKRVDMPISVAIEVNAEHVRVEVEDQGGGFKEDGGVLVPELATSGRGLFIMRQVMHRVERRTNGASHRVLMYYDL